MVTLPEQNKILLSQTFRWHAKEFGTREDLVSFLLRYLKPDEKARHLVQHMEAMAFEYLYYTLKPEPVSPREGLHF